MRGMSSRASGAPCLNAFFLLPPSHSRILELRAFPIYFRPF